MISTDIEKDPFFRKGSPPKDWKIDKDGNFSADGYAIFMNKESLFGGKFEFGIFKVDTKGGKNDNA